MQKKQADRTNRNRNVNILIAGIPSAELILHISSTYGKEIRLFICESRPYEEAVAGEIAALHDKGYSITLCTDNMIGALMKEYRIDAVWSLYVKEQEGVFTAVNGARMSAMMARAHGIPFMLYPHSSFPRVEEGSFAGDPVSVKGSGYITHELDSVQADLVTEAVANG